MQWIDQISIMAIVINTLPLHNNFPGGIEIGIGLVEHRFRPPPDGILGMKRDIIPTVTIGRQSYER